MNENIYYGSEDISISFRLFEFDASTFIIDGPGRRFGVCRVNIVVSDPMMMDVCTSVVSCEIEIGGCSA